MNKRRFFLAAICLLLIVAFAFGIYYLQPPKIPNAPELHLGQELHEMLDTYGMHYEVYGRIHVWKDQSWIILASFSRNNKLEQYGVYDLHHRYLYGNIERESIGSIWSRVLTGNASQIANVYEIGSGFSINGKITRAGVIVSWTDALDFEIIDPLNAAYSYTPWPFFLLVHPVLSWL